MANKPRSGLAGWQKALLWAVGLFVLWQVATTDTIGNGLLGFFLGGEVPGTSIVLPPEVILIGTLGVAVLILAVVVVRTWSGHRRVRKFRVELTESAAASAPEIESESESESKPEPAQEPEPVVAVVTAAEPVTVLKQRRIGPALAVVVAKTRQITRRILQRLGPWSQKVSSGTKKTGGRFVVHAIGAYELVRMATIFCAKWLGQHSMVLARWFVRWCKATGKKIRDWLNRSRETLRPHVKALAHKLAVAWRKIMQWLRRQSQGSVKQAKRAANSVKRMVRKSPIPGWVAGAQQKFRSPDQPEE